MFKKILIGVILLVLIGSVAACGGAQVAPVPTPNDSNSTTVEKPAPPEKPEEKLTQEKIKTIPVEEFLKEYHSSNFSEGDIIRVRGVVRKVKTYAPDLVVVQLEPGYNDDYLECDFTKNSEIKKAKNLRQGQEVVIEGKVGEFLITGYTRLTNSILLEW